jgi:glycosyltransferase involved in cell wall biosynthesis
MYTKHIVEADVVVVHSKAGGEHLKRKCGISDYVVIPHGCEIPNLIHRRIPEEVVVGHLGVNGADKGQVYLIEALQVHLGCKVKSVIAGNGTQIWGGMGYVPNPNVVYDSCSVYVQPSVTEGFGIPVLAHARAVIVTDGVGASDLVDDGVNGFIVPIRDSKAIADKIQYFIDHPSAISMMGEMARETAKKYTWGIIRKKYQELWK